MTDLALVGPHAPWVTVAAAVGLIIVTAWFARIGLPASLHALTGQLMPEQRWHYDRDDLEAYLSLDGIRPMYRSQLRWDLLFIALYGVGAALLVDGTWGRILGDRSHAIQVLVLAPVVLVMIVDVVEDAVLLVITDADDRYGLVPVAALATMFKLFLVIVTVLEIVTGLAVLATIGPRG